MKKTVLYILALAFLSLFFAAPGLAESYGAGLNIPLEFSTIK